MPRLAPCLDASVACSMSQKALTQAACLQLLLERTAFLNIAARQPARIRGHFTAAPYLGLFKVATLCTVT